MKTKNRGITLIALIITIIVLLILAGVTIATLTGNHGILTQVDNAKIRTIESTVNEEISLAVQSANLKIRTKKATDNSWNAVTEGILPTTAIAKTETTNITNEETNGAVLVTLLADLQRRGYNVAVTAVEGEGTVATRKITITYEGDDYKKATKDTEAVITKELTVSQNKIIMGTNVAVETIPTTEAYVGYYADVDGNGTVDGVIFADLAKGNTGDGQWTNSNGSYTIPKKEEVLKNYYISQAEYTGAFGTKPVLSPTGTGEDRFYVMSLSNFGGRNTYYWYLNAYGNMSDYSTATSGDFGKGKQNTEDMISAWNAKKYGEQDTKDMWGQIKEEVNKGWFVPSNAEWSAFAEELGITKSNYTSYSLDGWYWSSSQFYADAAWGADFIGGFMNYYDVYAYYYVRLATTF